jgi:dolichyl-phosphate beta-glucosyltransferase
MITRPPTLVVPCFNEGRRLDTTAFLGLLGVTDDLRLVMVDDGSTDETAMILRDLEARANGRVDVLSLPTNQGKAEAVREGLRRALADGAEITGYVDADLATPAREVRRLLALFGGAPSKVLLGSRVALLGREIRRNPFRHYLGRVFASAASLVLQLRVYDTQCGAKLFRRTSALEAALAEPFLSRWLFDVELP